MKKPPIFVMIFVLMVSGVSLAYAGQYQWRCLYEDAQHNFRTGLQAQSLALAKESLRKADVEYGTDSLYALKSLTLVGDLYAASGAYSESARYYRKALEVQKKIFGSPHPNTAKLLNSFLSSSMDDHDSLNGSNMLCSRIFSMFRARVVSGTSRP